MLKRYYKFSILFATYSILTLSCQGYKIVDANSSIIDIDKNYIITIAFVFAVISTIAYFAYDVYTI